MIDKEEKQQKSAISNDTADSPSKSIDTKFVGAGAGIVYDDRHKRFQIAHGTRKKRTLCYVPIANGAPLVLHCERRLQCDVR